MIATLTFDTTGIASGLYTEAIPLQTIGTLTISRASSIEFNEGIQEWEVEQDGKTLFSNASRLVCLAWEHEHFN